MSIEETLEERQKTHGEFSSHAEISQSIKREIMAASGYFMLSTDQREALDMIAHKIARILNGNPNYIDHWHDIAGYATLVEMELKNDRQIHS